MGMLPFAVGTFLHSGSEEDSHVSRRCRGSPGMKSLDGKVAVVTGAASGIGRALAVSLAGRGALLALCDVDEAGLADTVELADRAGAHHVHGDRLDVADRAGFAAYAASVAERFGRVNLVANNAGVALTGAIADLSYDDLDWIVGVNFWGV